MSGYTIYGIGAALVDAEVTVSDAFLSGNGIEKGMMTLVDEKYQSDLLAVLSAENIEVFRACGGSACNSIVAAASLGAKAFFSGKVAGDGDGELYIEDLKGAGVAFHSAVQESGTTGKCLVMITEDAERSMCTFLGASEALSIREIDFSVLVDSEWLYVEGYLFTDESRTEVIRTVIEFARAHGVKIALSLSDPIVVAVSKSLLLEIIGDGVDLIFCNREEAIAFTDAVTPKHAAESLKKYAKTFVITDGENGAMIYDSETIWHSPCVSTDAVDTNGAGDVFAGAFLYGISSGRNFQWAASLANYCASTVVAQFGPRLYKEQFVEIRAKFGIKD